MRWAIGLTVLGALLRFPTLGVQSLWYDEALTHDLVTDSFGGMLSGTLSHEAQPPLYFVLAWLWTHVLGSGDIGLRSLSALLGTLTVPVAFYAADAVAGRRAAIATGLLVAVSPPLVWYAQEARAYALVALLATVSVLALLRTLEEPATRWPVVWAVSALLAVASHYFALFLVLGEGAVLLWRLRDEPHVRRALGGALAGLLALTPMVLYQRAHGGVEWIGQIPLSPRVRDAAFFLGLGPSAPTALYDHRREIAVGVVVVLAAAAAAAIRWSAPAVRFRVLVLTFLAACVVVTPFVLAFAGTDLILDRNFLPALVPLLLVAAVGVTVPRLRRVGPVLVVLTALVWAFVIVDINRDDELQRDDWAAVLAYLGPPRGDRVIEVSPHWHAIVLRTYAPELAPLYRTRPATSFVTITLGGFVPYGQPVFALPPPASFRVVRQRTIQRLTVTEFRAPRAVPIDPAAFSPPGINAPKPFLQPAA